MSGPGSDGPDQRPELPIDPDVDPDEDARHHRTGGPFDQPPVRSRWPRLRWRLLAAVFVGGCLGGFARYGLTVVWPAAAGEFPWATFAVNNGGALLLAVLLVLVTDVLPPTTYVRPLLGTGFCGALTTFSAVTVTSDQLVVGGDTATGVLYLAASMTSGLACAAFGLVLGRSIAANRRDARAAGRPKGPEGTSAEPTSMRAGNL